MATVFDASPTVKVAAANPNLPAEPVVPPEEELEELEPLELDEPELDELELDDPELDELEVDELVVELPELEPKPPLELLSSPEHAASAPAQRITIHRVAIFMRYF